MVNKPENGHLSDVQKSGNKTVTPHASGRRRLAVDAAPPSHFGDCAWDFGWRAEPYSQVDVSLDTSQFHSGTRALRLVFSGPAGVSQYVPVQPNARYRLSTFVKSEEIVSASGPRIVVQDYYGNQALASTEDLLAPAGGGNCWLIS